MKRLKASLKFYALVLVGLIAVALWAGGTAARNGGITEEEAHNQGADLNTGATCHAPGPSSDVRAILEGVPGNYTAMPTPAEPYASRQFNLTVRFEGGPADSEKAGFNLRVSAGTLAAAEGEEEFMRIETEGLEATHTILGNERGEWHLVWTSPEEEGPAVVFTLIVNVIAGPDSRDPAAAAPTSEWNVASFASWGDQGPDIGAGPGHGLRVEEFGVGWLAYWVGIVSFVFLGIVLIAYYVVFRYGETSKATDHRARKGKSK